MCVLEGVDLIEAALNSSGIEFEALFVDQSSLEDSEVSALCDRADGQGVRVFALANGVIDRVADTQSPQPLLATVRIRVSELQDLVGTGLVLVLDNVRDPGNAGTIIRSADAAGAVGVVLTGECVDPFNPKTLRASAGSIFQVPVAMASLDETLGHFGAMGVRSYATVVRGGTPYRSADLSAGCVVVIGNEATGLDATARSQCDEELTIEMAGLSESLNAGVAASLIAFEALAQRRGTTNG